MQKPEQNIEVRETIDPAKLVFAEAIEEMRNPPPGVNFTLWPFFNELTGGLRTREFSILCGPTGCGKTTLLANISANLVCQRVKHFVASVEVGKVDYMRRMIAVMLEEELYSEGKVSEEKIKLAQDSLDIFFGPTSTTELNFSNIDNRMSCELLLSKLQHAHDVQGCKIAILDNLNFFLEISSAQNSLIEMDRVVHEIIMFCKRVDMHVIMVMHPKKTENGRVESEFDIKGSSTAVQEAHNVFLFNRPKKEEIERGDKTKYMRELKAAKLRRRGKYTGKAVLFDGEGPAYKEIKII